MNTFTPAQIQSQLSQNDPPVRQEGVQTQQESNQVQYFEQSDYGQKPQKKTNPKTYITAKISQSSPKPQPTPPNLQQSPSFTLQYYSTFFNCLSPYDSTINYQQLDKYYGHVLKRNNIWLTEVKNTAFSVHYKSLNAKVITVVVQIAHFAVQVEVYQDCQEWFDQVVKESGQVLGNGSEGRVIRLGELGCVMKQYNVENFRQTLFSYTIVEYAITKVASCYEIGPKLLRPFMFDVYSTKNYMYFFMQECQKPTQSFRRIKTEYQRNTQFQTLYIELKKSLYLLHRMQIVHFDVKPENIMFSPGYGKYILIDYGMAESKHFLQGQMQLEQFKGTFYYASEEMRELFLDRKQGYVDVYYNDCICLSKSLAILREVAGKRDDSVYGESQRMESQTQNQSYLGDGHFVSEFKEDSMHDRLVSDKIHHHVYEFDSLDVEDYQGDKGSFMANSLVVYVTYLLCHGMYAAVQKVLIKNEILVHSRMEELLGAFFEIGGSCYDSEVFLKLLKILQQANLTTEKEVFQPSLIQKKLPFDIKTCQMLQNNPLLINPYKAYLKKSNNSQMITSLSDMQSIKLSDLKQAQLNTKSIFYNKQTMFKEKMKEDTKFQTYYLIEHYVRMIYEKLCLSQIDLNKQSQLVSVFSVFHEILQNLSQLDRSYFPYYQRLVSQDSKQGKFNVMKESLDLVVAHMMNDDSADYVKNVLGEKMKIDERWTVLQEVCRALGRTEFIQGMEETLERRKLGKLWKMCAELVELVGGIDQWGKGKQVSSEKVMRCMDLTHIIGDMHKHRAGRCLIVLQLVAQGQGEDKMRAQIQKNRQYLTKYSTFRQQLKSLVSHLQKSYNTSPNPQLYTLIKQGFPQILKNKLHKGTQSLYIQFEGIIQGRFFKKWVVPQLEHQIDQFKSNMLQFLQTYGAGTYLTEEFVIEALRQFLFQIKYKCYIDNRQFYGAISSLQNHIMENQQIFKIGIYYRNFKYPQSVYYTDLFRLYVRVGLRHRAREILGMLRRLQQKELAEEIEKYSFIEIFKYGDDHIVQYSQKYYDQEEAKYLQENNHKNYSQEVKYLQENIQNSQPKSSLNLYSEQWLLNLIEKVPSLTHKNTDNNIKLNFHKEDLLDTWLVSQEGIRLVKKILVMLSQKGDMKTVMKFLLLVAGELERYEWGGFKMLGRFEKEYIGVLFDCVLKGKEQMNCFMVLKQIEANLMSASRECFSKIFGLNKPSHNISKQLSELELPSRARSTFVLAWTSAITLSKQIINQTSNNQPTVSHSASLFCSVLTVIKKCLVVIHLSQMSQQLKVQNTHCSHKSLINYNDHYQQRMQCAICLQTLINSYQQGDYILRPRKVGLHETFRVYMGLMYGKDYYASVRGVWQGLRDVVIREGNSDGLRVGGYKLGVEKVQNRIKWIGLLEVRNRHKDFGKRGDMEAQRIDQAIKEKFVRDVEMNLDLKNGTKHEICKLFKSKLSRLRVNICGS